jgi:hypothetical protein
MAPWWSWYHNNKKKNQHFLKRERPLGVKGHPLARQGAAPCYSSLAETLDPPLCHCQNVDFAIFFHGLGQINTTFENKSQEGNGIQWVLLVDLSSWPGYCWWRALVVLHTQSTWRTLARHVPFLIPSSCILHTCVCVSDRSLLYWSPAGCLHTQLKTVYSMYCSNTCALCYIQTQAWSTMVRWNAINSVFTCQFCRGYPNSGMPMFTHRCCLFLGSRAPLLAINI